MSETKIEAKVANPKCMIDESTLGSGFWNNLMRRSDGTLTHANLHRDHTLLDFPVYFCANIRLHLKCYVKFYEMKFHFSGKVLLIFYTIFRGFI